MLVNKIKNDCKNEEDVKIKILESHGGGGWGEREREGGRGEGERERQRDRRRTKSNKKDTKAKEKYKREKNANERLVYVRQCDPSFCNTLNASVPSNKWIFSGAIPLAERVRR